MKKQTQSAIRIIAVLTISLFFTQCKDAQNAAITKFMELQAVVVNKQCPQNIGNGVTMTGCKVEENRTFKFTFTIEDNVAKLISITDDMKPMVLQMIKSLPEFNQIKEYEISCVYAFSDASGKSLGEIKLTPEDYKKAEEVQINETEQMIKVIVSSMNPNLPVQIDEITTLVECKALPNSVIQYVYTISMEKKDVNADFSNNMKFMIKENVRNTPDMKKMIDKGVVCNYLYNDKNGVEICNINISSADYQ